MYAGNNAVTIISKLTVQIVQNTDRRGIRSH